MKFAELQLLMLQHNAGLTASHPYASGPINWPFLLNGISFWTDNDAKQQIYFAGNPVGWWMCVMALSVFVGIAGADLMARRRNVKPIPEGASRTVPAKSFTHTPFRDSKPPTKLHRILCVRLGVSLFPLLPHEPSTICPPLPSCSFSVNSRRRICSKFHSHRVHRVSDIDRSKRCNSLTSADVHRLRPQRTHCDRDIFYCSGCVIPLLHAVDLRYSRVRPRNKWRLSKTHRFLDSLEMRSTDAEFFRAGRFTSLQRRLM